MVIKSSKKVVKNKKIMSELLEKDGILCEDSDIKILTEEIKVNKVGRPADFKTPQELEDKVNEYFLSGYRMKKVVTGFGNEIMIPAITMTDLAIFLGFESRQSLYDYGIKPGFSYIIKRATLFIEREYEERLGGQSPTGAIFALKNMGWVDRQEIDQNTKHSGNINVIKPTLE